MTKDFSQSSLNWCFSTLGCPDNDLDQALALADKYKIDLIEIRNLSGTIDFIPLLETYIKEFPAKVDLLREQGRIASLDTSFPISAIAEQNRDEFLSVVNMADLFGAKHVRVFGGFPFSEELTQERLEQAAKTLAWFDKERAEKGFKCRMLLEVHDGFSSSDRCMELMNYAGKEIDILWDAHHSYRFANETFDYSWNLLSSQIKHIHVKDGLPIPGETEKVKHTLCGQGDIPVKNLIAMLKRVNFTGPVSLEWERFWDKDIPCLEDALDSVIHAGWL